MRSLHEEELKYKTQGVEQSECSRIVAFKVRQAIFGNYKHKILHLASLIVDRNKSDHYRVAVRNACMAIVLRVNQNRSEYYLPTEINRGIWM